MKAFITIISFLGALFLIWLAYKQYKINKCTSQGGKVGLEGKACEFPNGFNLPL